MFFPTPLNTLSLHSHVVAWKSGEGGGGYILCLIKVYEGVFSNPLEHALSPFTCHCCHFCGLEEGGGGGIFYV